MYRTLLATCGSEKMTPIIYMVYIMRTNPLLTNENELPSNYFLTQKAFSSEPVMACTKRLARRLVPMRKRFSSIHSLPSSSRTMV